MLSKVVCVVSAIGAAIMPPWPLACPRHRPEHHIKHRANVARMMRRDVKTVPADMPVSAFRAAFPLGSETRVAAVEQDGRYAGIVVVPEAHVPELPGRDRHSRHPAK